jgi:predicted nucleotide-binding protein (sugar kinase/HSP70/actin superfamily)
MRAIPRIDADPLHVGLIGEIYVVNEPFVNKEVEKTLGSLEKRVRVHRKLDLSNWVSYHLFKTPGAVKDYKAVAAMAESYLPVAVGGHGQESVGEAVMAKKHGYDGVLHLFPFTCMPEIIAQNVLVKISRDLDLPVLSLMMSEQTGLAGLTTRLEAFCDLLEGRRKGRRLNEVQV